MSPTFSVITPIFNGEDFVHRSYSLLSMQTFTDWEWVVVDDGSTDKTADLVRQIDDERVRLITYMPNRGRGYARTRALEAACGEWMVVWDVDDLYFPDRLEKINKARLEGYDFFCSYAVIVDKDLQIKGVRGFQSPRKSLMLCFVHPTLGCPIDIARRIGYNSSFRAAEDATMLVTLPKNYKGQFYDDALTIKQESREVNLSYAYALDCNTSQFQQLQQMYHKGSLEMSWWLYLDLNFKWRIKLLILNLMRLTPRLYLETVRLRPYGQKKPEWVLPPERIAFIEQIRSGNFQPDTVRLSQ